MKRVFSSGVFVPTVAFASTRAATLAAVAPIVHPVMAACGAGFMARSAGANVKAEFFGIPLKVRKRRLAMPLFAWTNLPRMRMAGSGN